MPELARNKRTNFDYEILQKYEAGIELFGFEVKSVRAGRLNLTGSYVIIKDMEAWLFNADLPAYQAMNTPLEYDPKRSRKLLLNKKEIRELITKTKESNLTVIPISCYTKGNLIKLSIGLAKPKKKADKRESIKKRETEREIRRYIK